VSAITIARRYGRAVLELVAQDDGIDKLEEDMSAIRRATRELPELIRGFSDVCVGLKKRVGAARNICSTLGVSDEMKNLMLLLIERGRIQILPEILDAIELGISAHRKHARVDVTVADSIYSGEIKSRLEKELGAMLGVDVECTVAEDKSLLGGFVVNIGNEQFDASVANKFKRMKERLLRGM
jgi:F-type H+-transporting ATPase subunit delta